MLKNIPKECDQINIKRCCSALRVSRSGYYVWIEQDQISDPNGHEMKIKGEIESITLDFPKYGYRRVKNDLYREQLIPNITCLFISI